MKKLYLLIPFLLLSVNTKTSTLNNKSTIKYTQNEQFSIETDTMLLSFVVSEYIKEIKELEELTKKEKHITSQIKKIEQKESDSKLLEDIRIMLTEYNYRGL